MFVVIVRYVKPIEAVDAARTEHRAFLAECYRNNQLIVSGVQNPRKGGVLISQMTDRDALWNILKQDPFYTQGLAEYDLIEFTPFQYHPDFESFCHPS